MRNRKEPIMKKQTKPVKVKDVLIVKEIVPEKAVAVTAKLRKKSALFVA